MNTVPTEPVSMSEIKASFPGEWVLIGNPVMDEGDLNVLSGILITHNHDKRAIAYLYRDKVREFDTYTLVYIRGNEPIRKHNRLIPLISRRIL